MNPKLLLIGAAVLLLASCDKQMNYNEYNIYDTDYVTRNFDNVGGFMTDIYNGSWSPANPKSATWSNMYSGIAACNTVLSKMQGLTFDELSLNKDYIQQMHRYKNYQYESRFMRAYFYFCLARQYGGVPIVTEDMTPTQINTLSRSSSDDVFKYIISECNDIQYKIVEDYSNLGDISRSTAENGRADKLAVMALKARAALYWASPLFNASNDKERWHQAATYNKELLDACAARGKKLTKNYADLWSTLNYSTAAITQEIIFARRYYSSSSGDHLVESYNYPVGIEGGAGGNCPTQDLVDAYDMKSGKPIFEAGSGYDDQNRSE